MSALPRKILSSRAAPWAALLTLSYLFRLPALLNARSTNSDAAIVGLQAIHMLKGELSPLLWGSGYQTSADAFVAMLFFAVLGSSPLVLMLSSLTLHVVSTCLAFVMLRRRFEPWVALLLVMALVVTPSSVHSYALYPPRQLSLTLAMASLFAIDSRRLAVGGLLATLAISADPYPMLLFPVIGLYALLVAWPKIVELAGFVAGAVVGTIPFVLIHRLPNAKSGPMTFTTGMLAHHVRLLWDECLPWALSYKVYYAHHVMDYAPWEAPWWFRLVGSVGALLVAGLVLYGLSARGPADVRKLGFATALTFPISIAAFLVSVMAMDHFSMRYLAVLTLMLPFAVAPAAKRLGVRPFAALYAPHLFAAAVAGWVGYGPFVRGIVPVRAPELDDDYALADVMRARGVAVGEADYWTSYRLTFLHGEAITVVPTNPGEDRYQPYRAAFVNSRQYAYVYDPGRSRESLAQAEQDLQLTSSLVDKVTVGRLTVFFVTR